MRANSPGKDELFIAAGEIADADERATYLDQACGDDLALRADIEELLRHDRAEDSVLDRSVPGIGSAIDESITEEVGTQIGPYRLLQPRSWPMLEKFNQLVEQTATNVSRRQFLGQIGRSTMMVAAGLDHFFGMTALSPEMAMMP